MNRLYKNIRNLKNALLPETNFKEAPIYPLNEYKAIYFSIPKVASTSWLRVCATLQNVDLDLCTRGQWFSSIPRINKEKASKYKNYFKFCFVRNPWDRLVSCYLNKIKTDSNYNVSTFENGIHKGFVRFGVFSAGMSFEKFVEAISEISDLDADPHFQSQYTFITNKRGKTLVDFIGKIENSDKDFSYVLERVGITDISFPHDKKTHVKKNYREYYTKNLRDMVERRFSKDIKLFNYKF